MADETGETPALEIEVQETTDVDAGGEDTPAEEAAVPETAVQGETADLHTAAAPEEGEVSGVVQQTNKEEHPPTDPDQAADPEPPSSDPPATTAADDPPAAAEAVAGDETGAVEAPAGTEAPAEEENYEDDTEPAADPAETPEHAGGAAIDPTAADGTGEPATAEATEAAEEPGVHEAADGVAEGGESVAVADVSDETALGDDAAAGVKEVEDPAEISGALMEEALPEPIGAPEATPELEPTGGEDASLNPAVPVEAVAGGEGEEAASELVADSADVAAEGAESAPAAVVEAVVGADAEVIAPEGEEAVTAIAVEPESAAATVGMEGEAADSSRPATAVPTDETEPLQDGSAPEAPYSVSEVTPQTRADGSSTPDVPLEAPAAAADNGAEDESDGEEPDEDAVDQDGNKIPGAMKPKRRPKQKPVLADSLPPTDDTTTPISHQDTAAPAVAEAAEPAKPAPAASTKAPVAAAKAASSAADEPVAASDAITPEDVVGKGLASPTTERSPRAGTVESLGDAVNLPSPSKKAAGPWLQGTFKTPKGRVMTAEELCVSLQHMTSPYSEKFDLGVSGPPGQPFIGTGNRALVKTMPPDEIEAMVGRLYTSKEKPGEDEGKMEHQMLRYDDTGKEKWVPVKRVGQDEQKEYMCELYQRCLDSKKKANEALAVKYLQPLGKTRRLP